MYPNQIKTREKEPFPWLTIENFLPESIVRAAAASYDEMTDDKWVKYGGDDSGQIQYCNQLGRHNIPSAALLVLDTIALKFDPNKEFGGFNEPMLTDNAFPDTEYYGGGMMLTPNTNNEGGYLGFHVDATTHGKHKNWKREYSAILCLSEDYDRSFDLEIRDNEGRSTTIPYKFNQLNVFKCSDSSWHGLPEITKGLDRKTLGVMYWSKIPDEAIDNVQVKAKFWNERQAA